MARPSGHLIRSDLHTWRPPAYLTADLRLIPLGDERTRLITRLHTVYEWRRALALGTVLLMELADYPMMRRMLRGIRERVEAKQATGPERVGWPWCVRARRGGWC